MDEINEVTEDLFAEDTPEAETMENTEVSEETPVEETPVTTEFLKVKFNGEERSLTEDEARTYAQKGMNYDRFYEPIERLARLNNMSVGDYVNQLNSTQEEYEVESEMENLRNDSKYENVSDEVLEEIARSRVRESIGKRDTEQQKLNDDQSLKIQRELDHFFEEYPEFKNRGPEALDPKVFEFVGKGYTLLEAYNKYQRINSANSRMEQKAKVEKLNEENRKKSIGNTTNAGGAAEDAFLSGFLAD